MTLQEFKDHIAKSEASIRDKGYNRVRINCYVEAELHWYSIEYYVNSSDDYNDAKRFYANTDEELETALSNIPPKIDILRKEFLGRLASLVETAETLDLNIPELRPLFETYRNNLLEHHA